MTTSGTGSADQSAELIERALLQIASGVLKRADVSSHVDLFKIYGMQSLTALRVVVAARGQEIGLSIADLYLYRTVHAVARHLASATTNAADA